MEVEVEVEEEDEAQPIKLLLDAFPPERYTSLLPSPPPSTYARRERGNE